ncbi:MAG TPA: hypothetical protein VGG97_04035 [Bryobacteraceae bacterium]
MTRLLTQFTRLASRGFLIATLGLLLSSILAPGQTSNPKPITKNGLTRALQIGGLSQKELVEQVTHRGVDFSINPEIEADLSHAGATPALLQAVRENYRPASAGTTASHADTDSALAALDTPDPANSAPHASHANTETAGAKHPMALRDVHKLYIEKMPNGLDGYLRAAISHKLGSYFTIVLERSEADAILQNTGSSSTGTVSIVDPGGKLVLWSGSADDKEKAYLNFRHGGQREVAEKLAGQLRKSLD